MVRDCDWGVHRGPSPSGPGSARIGLRTVPLPRAGPGQRTLERQKALPVRYKGIELQAGYRLDLVVGGQLLVELKAVERLLPVHEAQVITYLKLSGLPVGLLVNFHAATIRQGLRRLTNNRTLPGFPPPCDPHDC